MNRILFDGLNQIRRNNNLTFNERKFLETALSRTLLEGTPFTNNLEILNVKRVAREDMRRIDTTTLFQQARELLTAVTRG